MTFDAVQLAKTHREDESMALRWWRETDDKGKTLIWLTIQAMGGNNNAEIISRFAQLGMTHIAILAEKQKEAN